MQIGYAIRHVSDLPIRPSPVRSPGRQNIIPLPRRPSVRCPQSRTAAPATSAASPRSEAATLVAGRRPTATSLRLRLRSPATSLRPYSPAASDEPPPPLASASESDHKVRAHDPTTRPLPATDPSPCSRPSRLDRSSRVGSGPPRRSDLTLLGWWRRLLARGLF